MFRVIFHDYEEVVYHDYQDDRTEDFNDLDKAINFAKVKCRKGWYYVAVIDEFENTIVEYKN